MKTKEKMAALLIAITCLGFLSGIGAQELRKERKYWVGEITKNFKVQKGGALVMDEVRGDITIKTWEKAEVQIHEVKRMDIFTKSEAEAAMEESKTGYVQEGNTITIGGPAFDRKWIQSTFEIFLPVEFNCNIETQGGELTIEGIKGTVDASTGGGEVTLTKIDGPVKAKTGGGEVLIRSTTQRVFVSTGGGNVELTDCGGTVEVKTGGGEINIERTKGDVSASTGGGDVEIRETQGGVNVSTGGGEIDIIDATGDVTAKTGGGDIHIRNINGNFNASTGGGSVEGSSIKGSLDVHTGGGEIKLGDVQGAIEVSTGGGDINIAMSLKDFSIDHHMEIKTGGGDIEISLPEKLPASIQAEIKYDRRRWEDYKITSDFPLQITTEDEGSRYRIIRATGDINGGGDLIHLRTGGGNIRIRKVQR